MMSRHRHCSFLPHNGTGKGKRMKTFPGCPNMNYGVRVYPLPLPLPIKVVPIHLDGARAQRHSSAPPLPPYIVFVYYSSSPPPLTPSPPSALRTCVCWPPPHLLHLPRCLFQHLHTHSEARSVLKGQIRKVPLPPHTLLTAYLADTRDPCSCSSPPQPLH